MSESLYQKIYAAQQANTAGKKRVGYTVGAYAGVLSALQKADMIVVEEQVGGTLYEAEVTYTNTDVVVNGFFQNDKKQAEVTFNNYMSFIVDVNGSKEAVNVPSNISDHDGISIIGSGNMQYPPSKLTKENNESCKLGTGNFGGFVIGVGVSFDSLLLNFFKQFYGEMPWEAVKLEKLAGAGAIYAELMIAPTAGTGTARVIQTKVTVKATKTIDTGGYQVYVPIPLMLLNNYKSIGEVTLKVSDNSNGVKEYKVDGSTVSFPSAGSSYDKNKAIINNFTPDMASQYVTSDDTVIVDYVGSTLVGKKGRVRFYFGKEFEAQVVAEVGTIPDSYKSDLFKGVLEGDGNFEIVQEQTSAGVVELQDGDIYWDESVFAGLNITKQQYEKCVRIVWDFEVGTPNADWFRCEDVGDAAGISYGPYQYTEKSGLLSKVVRMYLDSKGIDNYNDNDRILANCSISNAKYTGTQYVRNKTVMNALKAVGAEPLMKMAQGKMFLDKRAKPAISHMRDSGMTSALGLQQWMYYINHGYNRANYISAVKGASGETAKCTALANAHENRLRGLRNWSKYKNGWLVFINAHRRAINGGNFDLSKVQKWRNNSF